MVKPIRILQAFVSDDGGGLTKYICQNYKFIDRNKVQFDFLTFDSQLLAFENDLCAMGARVYHIPRPSEPLEFYNAIKEIIENNEYKAVHFHLSYANFVPVLLTKLAGANRIFIHSHSTEIDDDRWWVRKIKFLVHCVGRLLWSKLGNEYFACSNLAGIWMYRNWRADGDKYHLAFNGIEVDKYIYNQAVRAKKRKKLGVSDENFVVGHIGRFCYQKNQEFLINVFARLLERVPQAKLLLIGTGDDERAIRTQAERLGILGNVCFLGRRTDVAELYQAMDVFVLPSRFEGLVIVGIEAQAAGLQCVISDAVSKELAITDLVKYVSLSRDVDEWADVIEHCQGHDRLNQSDHIRSSGYDIVNSAKLIEELYLRD